MIHTVRINKQAKDIALTFLNQVWRLVSGPLMLLLIPLYLTEEQQGYWYLFGSIAALSMLADLGFSNIILQFAAHEYAFVKMHKDGLLYGNSENIQKIGSLFRFVVRWLLGICSVAYPIIFAIGIWFFIRDEVIRVYILPWVIYSIGSCVSFINNSILSFIEGLEQIAKVQQSRLIVAAINTVVVAICLLFHCGIFSLAFGMLLSALFLFFTIFKTFGTVVMQIWQASRTFSYPWKKEILPLFKKYVLSFTSGYFLTQIYTPLMHYFHGAVYGGKVGISMILVGTMFSFSNIWVYTVTPRINILIEQKAWQTLDDIFYKRLLYSLLTYLFIAAAFFVFMTVFGNSAVIRKAILRFLPAPALLLLMAAQFVQLFTNAWAVYLRGHKIEPYWYINALAAVWVVLITVLVGTSLPPEYFFIGLLSSYAWVIPWSYILFRRWKKKLHTC